MYFPEKYNNKVAIELGNLIQHAYNQFIAFEEKKQWVVPIGYKIITELTYPWNITNTFDQNNILETYLKNIFVAGQKKAIVIPIGFIAEKSKNIYIVFRGTQTVKEWINNINIKLEKHYYEKFGYVHDGFLASYKDIRIKIINELSKVEKVNNIYITGHSLGGAFALLSAIDIEKESNKKIKALYTFGSPRVGDNEFVIMFNKIFRNRAYRIINTSDIVTEIPFPTPIAGIFGGYFSHIEIPVAFTEQYEDIEKNHDMSTYLGALNLSQNKYRIIQFIKRKFV